jgi:hypothetical protein
MKLPWIKQYQTMFRYRLTLKVWKNGTIVPPAECSPSESMSSPTWLQRAVVNAAWLIKAMRFG